VRRPVNPRGDWLAGCVLGAWSGFSLVYVPPFGAILFVAFLIPAAILRAPAAIPGLLVGSGGVMLQVIALATWSCTNVNSRAGESCTPPDVTGLLVAGFAMVLIGGALTARAVIRSRRI
jgi:hypothetical protein